MAFPFVILFFTKPRSTHSSITSIEQHTSSSDLHVVMSLPQYLARPREIKATFDLGDGAYYRAWIDAILPVFEAFVQANIDPKKAVIVYDQQGKRIASSNMTDYSNALVLRCDEHRLFDILEPPSNFAAPEQISLPRIWGRLASESAISADGYRYKTSILQDRISLFRCMVGLTDGAGPNEFLYRFDCWITKDHRDLRSQLDKLLKEHEGN